MWNIWWTNMCPLKRFVQYLVHTSTKMVGNTYKILMLIPKLLSRAFTFKCSRNHMSSMTHVFGVCSCYDIWKQRNPRELGHICILSLQKTTLTWEWKESKAKKLVQNLRTFITSTTKWSSCSASHSFDFRSMKQLCNHNCKY
jgi:hypothetical protein